MGFLNMAKIILLNGCGSSGKTSIARSIQHISNDHWLTFGIDTFIQMTPYPSKDSAGYFDLIPGENENGPTMKIESGPRSEQLFGLMPHFASLLSDNHNNLIIDEVLFDDHTLHGYIKSLANHTVYFIAVECSLSVMQEREFLRQDRSIGLSNDQINRVHNGLRKYDLIVNSTSKSNFSIANEILNHIKTEPNPLGFKKMAEIISIK